MVYCSALNCQNATSGVYKNSAVTFHGFPLQNKPLLRQWIHNMGRDMGMPSKHQRLCSKHFEDSSFETDPLKIRKNRRLLKEAVPKKFILGEDGNWLVGTPRSFCAGMSNKTRKRIRNPEHSWICTDGFIHGASCKAPEPVPEPLGNAAAREGKDLEDWQKECDEKVIKENYESLTTAGKGSPVPRSNTRPRELLLVKDQRDFEEREIPKSLSAGCGGSVVRCELRSEAKASEDTEPHGSFSGGPRGLACQISDKGVTSENHQNSGEGQADPTGSRRGSSSREEREPDEFRERRCYQQTHPGESLCLCAECRKTSTLKIGLLSHKQMHTRKNRASSYICTDCGKSFGRHADLVRHQRTHTGERPYKCTECEKSFVEKPRLTNHLRTHNVYL